ncbi:MAG TPA: tyrosine-type recombinase/integrase, partial [Burkholderiaceae bacterium]|nr:tyrosine-type recombinase/integrase [Burkholderiaceae bacterium]
MAKGTLKLKRHHLTNLAKRMPLAQVTEDDLVAHLSNPDWGPESRKSARSTFRGFYAWAFRKGLVDHDPSVYLKPVRVPAARPRPVPEPQVMDAVAFGDDEETTLMVLLAAYGGLRASEIAGLRTDSMTPYGIRVMGKGSKERIIPVHPSVLAPLSKRIRRSDSEWVFPSTVRNGHVGYDYVYKRVKAALGGKYTPHQLRHRFATQAYKGTQDLRAVQELLGHSSPTTTVRYTLIENEAMAAAVRAVA